VTGRLTAWLFVAMAGAAATDCHPPAQTSASAAAPDSIKGIVSVTGTGFEQRVVLRSQGDNVTLLSAATADSAALSRLGGVEVLAIGQRSGNELRVERFTAISVAGAPVVDGVLRDDNGKLMLETTQGRVQLGNPPAALRNLVAARVWIGGPLDRGPNTYGVIAPPPAY
jgi:hypothetical protein